MHISNFFRLSYWLDPAVLDQRAGSAMGLVVLVGLAWGVAGIIMLARRRWPPDVALAQVVAGALIAGVAAGRLFAIPVLGLRVGWLVTCGLAAAPLAWRVVRQALRDGLVEDSIRALSFGANPSPSARATGSTNKRIGVADPVHSHESSAAVALRRGNGDEDGTLRATASQQAEDGPAEDGGSATALEHPAGVPVAVVLAAVALRRDGWRTSTALAWLGLHLIGMAAVMSIIKLPVWFAPALIGVLLTPNIIAYIVTRTQSPHFASHLLISSLAPLLLVYVVLASRLVVGAIARITLGQFRVVEPFGALLNLHLVLIVASGYGLAVATCQAFGARRVAFVKFASAVLIASAVAWSAWNALTLHTQGVSGSDPYAYAQMGVDLAEHGTLFHPFPLIRLTYGLNIPSEPIIHVGYKLPQDVRRVATTVWPPGYAVFTALGYLLAGEQGLYLITPLLSLLALAVIAGLAHGLAVAGWGQRAGGFPLAIAALSVFLTATSYQQVEWQLIPMADIAAQLFSLLALALALGAGRMTSSADPSTSNPRATLILAALGGLALGMAFDIRYTQVLIAPVLAYALFTRGLRSARARPAPFNVRLVPVVVCGLFALLAAAPVLVYHTVAFGGPLQTGSEELSNFSLPSLPETLLRISAALASPREFGLLLPFIAVGMVVLWRFSRHTLLVLALYFVPLFLLHVAYAYLRPRDILPLFPVLSILAALGAGWLVMRLICDEGGWMAGRVPLRPLATIALVLALAFAVVLRSMDTLALPVTHGFGAFGYLVREQRASFTRLGELTPSNAAIGCSLNSGAVDLYARRLTFRPASWTPDQLLKFVRALRQEHTPVYLLADGAEVDIPLSTLRQQYRLTEVARLDMPYYFPGSGSENRQVALYRLDG